MTRMGGPYACDEFHVILFWIGAKVEDLPGADFDIADYGLLRVP